MAMSILFPWQNLPEKDTTERFHNSGPIWARAHMGPGPYGPGPIWAKYQNLSVVGTYTKLLLRIQNRHGHIYIYIYSPNSLCCRGSGGVSSVLGIPLLPIFAPYAREILCAGAVNGDGHVAPVYAKVVRRITFAEKNI